MTELFSEIHQDESDPRTARSGVWVRRGFMTLFAAWLVVGLTGTLGQPARTDVARTAGATLTVEAPKRLRGGLFFQSRVDVEATSVIQYPRLVLDQGWFEGMQVNSIEPQPMSEASRDGRVVLSYDTLNPGDHLRVWLQFEVDPTRVGKQSYGIEIDDQTRRLARIDRDMVVLP
jgi:hypothetical protein